MLGGATCNIFLGLYSKLQAANPLLALRLIGVNAKHVILASVYFS
jgi:hypothetical protein